MNDDLRWSGDVEVGLLQGRHVVVDQVLRFLRILPGEEKQMSSDGLWRRRQHVQVVEWAVVVEAAEIAVANGLLVAPFPVEIAVVSVRN